MKKVTKSWVRVDDVDKGEPAAEVNLASVIQFRNGLGKLSGEKLYKGTMAGTLAYRAMLDLDHLARLLDSLNRKSTMTMTYVIKPANAESAKKMAALVKRSKWRKVKA